MTANTSDDKEKVARCETAGEDLFAIAGGYRIQGDTDGVVIEMSRPDGLAGEVPAGWRVAAHGAGDGNWTLEVYAVCANVN